MIVYEVNLEVDNEIADEFDAWLAIHADEMTRLPGFRSATLWRVDGGDDGNGRARRCAQYAVADRAALDRYLAGPAERMRADGVERFGSRFRASRRVLAPLAD